MNAAEIYLKAIQDILAAQGSGGAVSITGSLPAGNNNIGDVDIASLPALPVGNNNIGDVDIASFPVATLNIQDAWRAHLEAEETANDSDKTFTVPANREWRILSIWVELVATATVGARQLTIEIQDSASDVIGQFKAKITQAASLTYNYMYAPGLENMAAISGTYLSMQLPPVFLPAGYKVRVYDSAAIDAAADDMVVQMMVAERTV